MLKTPLFWSQKNTLLEKVLWPLSFLYEVGHRIRWLVSKPIPSHTPILCVGNTGVGGAGKTPTSLALGKLLQEMGCSYKYLTRGYGGKEEGPLVVRPSYHSAHQVGDEPLLLAEHQTTIMSKNRAHGLTLIKPGTTDTLIMDDGYQNPSIEKHLHVLVIDGKLGFGNGKVFPAGPLREPLSMSLQRASAIVLIGKSSREVTKALKKVSCPIFKATLKITPPPSLEKKLYAFAGIAFPEKFFDSLKKEKFKLVEKKAFPDHYPYKDLELQKLRRESRTLGTTLVTTEKDYMRLSLYQRKFVTPIPVALEWEEESLVKDFLKTHLA